MFPQNLQAKPCLAAGDLYCVITAASILNFKTHDAMYRCGNEVILHDAELQPHACKLSIAQAS